MSRLTCRLRLGSHRQETGRIGHHCGSRLRQAIRRLHRQPYAVANPVRPDYRQFGLFQYRRRPGAGFGCTQRLGHGELAAAMGMEAIDQHPARAVADRQRAGRALHAQYPLRRGDGNRAGLVCQHRGCGRCTGGGPVELRRCRAQQAQAAFVDLQAMLVHRA